VVFESSFVEFSNTVNAKTNEGIYDIYIMNRNTLYNFCTKVQEVADFNAAMSAAAKSFSHWALAFWIQENLLQRRPSGAENAMKNYENWKLYIHLIQLIQLMTLELPPKLLPSLRAG